MFCGLEREYGECHHRAYEQHDKQTLNACACLHAALPDEVLHEIERWIGRNEHRHHGRDKHLVACAFETLEHLVHRACKENQNQHIDKYRADKIACHHKPGDNDKKHDCGQSSFEHNDSLVYTCIYKIVIGKQNLCRFACPTSAKSLQTMKIGIISRIFVDVFQTRQG